MVVVEYGWTILNALIESGINSINERHLMGEYLITEYMCAQQSIFVDEKNRIVKYQ